MAIKTAKVRIFLTVALLVTASGFPRSLCAQRQQENLVMGGESFAVGMTQHDAMKKLEKCCTISGGIDPRDTNVKSFIIGSKNLTEFFGAIWFRGEKVERLDRNGEFSQNPEAVTFAASLYRLLSRYSSSGAAAITLQTGTSEMSGGSAKVVTFVFRDGRSIQMEILIPDTQGKLHNQVGLKEIFEKQ